MRIGVTVPMALGEVEDGRMTTFADTADFSRRAERLGIDSIWVFDHLLWRFEGEVDEGPNEAWTILSALAAAIPRVELGTLVLSTSFRNAGLLAKMAQTLDDVSGQRLILGIGCGWHQPEYEAFGYPFDHLVGRFEEDIQVIDRLLRGESVDFDGRWSRYRGAQLLPPASRRTPILVASKGQRMLRLTAKYADAWNTAWFGRVDDMLSGRLRDLDEALDTAGRDPASMRRTVGIRLNEPGDGSGEDGRATDADAGGLADLFDELESIGFADSIVWASAKTPAAIERIAEARELHRARTIAVP
jgi:alkanesulfonate monooxygenase SsuD/methylene tetrahydromethanopterin reductase-like flavin-dependent oxidoreductase (luciferase family)